MCIINHVNAAHLFPVKVTKHRLASPNDLRMLISLCYYNICTGTFILHFSCCYPAAVQLHWARPVTGNLECISGESMTALLVWSWLIRCHPLHVSPSLTGLLVSKLPGSCMKTKSLSGSCWSTTLSLPNHKVWKNAAQLSWFLLARAFAHMQSRNAFSFF